MYDLRAKPYLNYIETQKKKNDGEIQYGDHNFNDLYCLEGA